MIRFRWSCTCGSSSRKAFDDRERAEHDRWRHETQRCGPRYASAVVPEESAAP